MNETFLKKLGEEFSFVPPKEPGTDTVEFTVLHPWGDVSAEREITVLDASRLTFGVKDAINCDLKWQGSTLYVIPNPTGTPSFTLLVFARDSRDERSGEPAYALSDGPDLSTDDQKLTFGGGGSPTSNDDDEVLVDAVDGGDEVIHATAVTDATGATITGDLQVRIVALSTVGPLIVS